MGAASHTPVAGTPFSKNRYDAPVSSLGASLTNAVIVASPTRIEPPGREHCHPRVQATSLPGSRQDRLRDDNRVLGKQERAVCDWQALRAFDGADKDLVRAAELQHRYPAQLSGGQRQRMALARALAVDPQVLLLDEPFGALDAKVRDDLRRWLRRLHDEVHVTTVLVTHDQEEALDVADRIAVLNAGRIEQVGVRTTSTSARPTRS